MSSNKYSELLEKYYNGLTSVEEERWLKNNSQLAEQQLPLAAPDEESPAMDWNFDEFLLHAKQQQPTQKVSRFSIMPWMKYAASIIVVAFLAIALYNNKGNSVDREKVNIVANTAEVKPVAEKSPAPANNTVITKPAIKKAIAIHSPVKTKKYSNPLKQSANQQKSDDFFVIVNGKRITNENEALSILQQSLNSISADVKETMAGINNSPKLNVKFK